jgi:hypothetical protein
MLFLWIFSSNALQVALNIKRRGLEQSAKSKAQSAKSKAMRNK